MLRRNITHWYIIFKFKRFYLYDYADFPCWDDQFSVITGISSMHNCHQISFTSPSEKDLDFPDSPYFSANKTFSNYLHSSLSNLLSPSKSISTYSQFQGYFSVTPCSRLIWVLGVLWTSTHIPSNAGFTVSACWSYHKPFTIFILSFN